LFQAASGGTLFLDEVADLPLSMQVKLLRAIQEKAVRPIGAQREDTTDVRILSATHKGLGDEVDTGNFRQDLYYRLNVIELAIPALRDHAQDVPELANRALTRLANEYGGDTPNLSAQATQALQEYDFPGNVRELENFLERAFTLCENNEIQPEDLQLRGASTVQRFASPIAQKTTPPTAGSAGHAHPVTQSSSKSADFPAALPEGQNLQEFLEQIERKIITKALEATRWNKTAAAKALGITFRALRYKLKKLELE
jgi:two-component system response regulator PilR (NtrC family)